MPKQEGAGARKRNSEEDEEEIELRASQSRYSVSRKFIKVVFQRNLSPTFLIAMYGKDKRGGGNQHVGVSRLVHLGLPDGQFSREH